MDGTYVFRIVPGSASSIIVWVLTAGLAAGNPAADPTVEIPAARDNTLYEDATGSVSNGAGSAMFAGRNSQPSHSIRRAVIRFDLAGAIPSGSTIHTTELTLYNSATNVQDETVSLHRILRDWGEGTSLATGGQGSGAAATADDATWLHSNFPSQFWAVPGGDFVAGPSASRLVGDVGSYTWSSTPEMVADVQSWLDDPANNFGWIILGNEGVPSTAKRFSTREEPDADRRPLLVVQFTPPEVPALSERGLIVMFLSMVVAATAVMAGRAAGPSAKGRAREMNQELNDVRK